MDFTLSSTTDEPYKIISEMSSPLDVIRHNGNLNIKLINISFANNFRNLYLLGKDNIQRCYNRFILHCGTGSGDYIYKQISIDDACMYSLETLLQQILISCNQMLSPSDIEKFGNFNISYGVDKIGGKVYFKIDTSANPNLSAYLLEFNDNQTDAFNGSIGYILGNENYKMLPINGIQYIGISPLAQFIENRILLKMSNRIQVSTSYKLSQLPQNSSSNTVTENILYDFCAGAHQPYEKYTITDPTIMPIAVLDRNFIRMLFSFTDIAGMDLKPVDNSVLNSIRFALYLD